MNREEWLNKAVVELSNLFNRKGLELPTNISVSCGWPSKAIAKSVGECWSNDQSDGGVFEVFISPRLCIVASSMGVLSTLVHELLHISIGIEHSHKKPFQKAMKIIGLEGKATSTEAGPDLLTELEAIAKTLGEYPHKSLNLKGKPVNKPIKKTLKACCPECDYVIQVKRTLFEEKGAPICPVHGKKFEEEKIEGTEDVK